MQLELFALPPTAAAPRLPERDQDFYLFRDRTSKLPWRWEGTRRFIGRKSERFFKTQEQATADAQKQLRTKQESRK